MAKKRKTQIAKFIKEIEATAKRLRADVQKRAKAAGLSRNHVSRKAVGPPRAAAGKI